MTAAGLTCAGGSTTQAVPCGASYPLHTVVTLTAAPDPNSTFAGWGGSCTGTGTCQVTLSTARFVVANFTKLPATVALRYYHTDPVGSVRAITDEVGAVVERHDYRPFGEDVAPLTGDPNRFAGKQLDPEAALVYERAVSERVDGAEWGIGAPESAVVGESAGAEPLGPSSTHATNGRRLDAARRWIPCTLARR